MPEPLPGVNLLSDHISGRALALVLALEAALPYVRRFLAVLACGQGSGQAVDLRTPVAFLLVGRPSIWLA